MVKADLSKGYQNSKRKLGVATHFSEIVKLKFGKKLPYIPLYFYAFFRIMVAKLSLKKAWSPTFFFSDSNNPC